MALAIAFPIVLLFALPGWLLLGCIVLLVAWMTLTHIGQQTWSVARVGIATLPQRFGASAVVVVGIAGVVGVLVALLAMGAGFEATLRETGTDNSVIVMQAGAQSELNSAVTPETVALVSQAPQVLKNAEERSIVSPELVLTAMLQNKGGHDANVVIRGVGERAWDLWPHVRIRAGRKFTPGLQELIVGKGIHTQFAGTEIGSTLTLNGQPWGVVGIFDSGDAHSSEIWADTNVVGSAFQRGTSKTSLTVQLTDARALDEFKARLANDPRLKVEVQTTRQYYGRQSAAFTRIIRILGMTVGAIMAFGALFGVLNTMYSAVAARAREIATLRAIGFRRVPMIVSVLLETMLLAVLGWRHGSRGGVGNLRRLHRLNRRREFQPDGVRHQSLAGFGLERPQVGTCDCSRRRATPRCPSSAHADYGRLARTLVGQERAPPLISRRLGCAFPTHP